MSAITAACRSCGQPGLQSILDLGRMPLANALLTEEQLDKPEPAYPLELAFCPGCALVQITETVPPAELFGEYLYFSSFSETMVRHAKELADELIASRRLHKRSSVVEIASNDGYLLQHYQSAGVLVLGVEPAANIAKVAREKRGIRTLCDFFNLDVAMKIVAQGDQADVIHAHNVLAHVADLNGFVAGIEQLLKPDGVAVIEAPYVKDLIDRCEFDTIYHEHLCYFSLTALDRLFLRHGLVIADVKRVAIHGGSLRIFAARAASAEPSAAVKQLLAEEQVWGVDNLSFYKGFAERVNALRDSLCSLLRKLKQEKRTIAAYGAAAKGSTLLNFFGIGSETLEFVADRSTYKQGRYMPGVHLPIVAPEQLLESMPDYVLLLAWNFADEIIAQQADYRQRGGQFIVPIPEPKIVTSAARRKQAA